MSHGQHDLQAVELSHLAAEIASLRADLQQQANTLTAKLEEVRLAILAAGKPK